MQVLRYTLLGFLVGVAASLAVAVYFLEFWHPHDEGAWEQGMALYVGLIVLGACTYVGLAVGILRQTRRRGNGTPSPGSSSAS